MGVQSEEALIGVMDVMDVMGESFKLQASSFKPQPSNERTLFLSRSAADDVEIIAGIIIMQRSIINNTHSTTPCVISLFAAAGRSEEPRCPELHLHEEHTLEGKGDCASLALYCLWVHECRWRSSSPDMVLHLDGFVSE